jgi:hypothetical protein
MEKLRNLLKGLSNPARASLDLELGQDFQS